MRLPFTGRLLLAGVLSTTTACAAFEDPVTCTKMDISSAIEISQDLIPSKGGSVEVCVDSECSSIDLPANEPYKRSSLVLPDAAGAHETNVTLRIITGGKTTFDGKTTAKPEKAYPNGQGC